MNKKRKRKRKKKKKKNNNNNNEKIRRTVCKGIEFLPEFLLAVFDYLKHF